MKHLTSLIQKHGDNFLVRGAALLVISSLLTSLSFILSDVLNAPITDDNAHFIIAFILFSTFMIVNTVFARIRKK